MGGAMLPKLHGAGVASVQALCWRGETCAHHGRLTFLSVPVFFRRSTPLRQLREESICEKHAVRCARQKCDLRTLILRISDFTFASQFIH